MSYNIKEIAARAGVSKSTVSRVISGRGYASQDARERVMGVIETLQYKPNAVARAMVSQRTNNIGVIVFRERHPIVSHPIYGKIIDAILEEAQSRGYSVFLTTDREMSLASTDFMLEKRVDGLILLSRLRQNVIDHVKKFKVPYLMVNGSTADPEVIHLISRDGEGGHRAAEHLYGLGHRSMLVIAGPQEHRSHALRLKGFTEEMERLGNGGAIEVLHASESSFELGYRLMNERLRAGASRPWTALFATNDMLALGAMKRLTEQGVSVPGSIAVMGFDDIALSAMYTPALTTVRVDAGGMGRDAVALLDRLINGESGLPRLNEYESELIVRASTQTGSPSSFF